MIYEILLIVVIGGIGFGKVRCPTRVLPFTRPSGCAPTAARRCAGSASHGGTQHHMAVVPLRGDQKSRKAAKRKRSK